MRSAIESELELNQTEGDLPDKHKTMDPIESLIQTYNELNPPVIDELDSVPTSVQLMRYVAKNRPFLVRNGAKDWDAVKNWNAAYLRQKLQRLEVKVAVTPEG